MEGIYFCTCRHWEITLPKMDKHMADKHGYKSHAYERNLGAVTTFLAEYRKEWKLVARN